MSAANVSAFIRPGYPVKGNDVSGDYFTHVYRGPTSTLESNLPVSGDAWASSYIVRSATINPLANSNFSEMIVESTIEGSPGIVSIGEVTNNEFPFYEVEWVSVEKSLREHPAFSGFTSSNWQAVDEWIGESDTTARAALKYWPRDKTGSVTVSSAITLGTSDSPGGSEQDFAKLYGKGVEAYIDYLPVARKTSVYETQTKPSTSGVGTKIGGNPFTGVPAGYEWIKTADRASKQGRGFKWTKTEEWTGAISVLVDVEDIYI